METSHIHKYLMTKWGLAFRKCEVPDEAILPKHRARSWATLGEFGQVTSCHCLHQKYTASDILFYKINLWVRSSLVKRMHSMT